MNQTKKDTDMPLVIDRPLVATPSAVEKPIEVPGGATVMLLDNNVTPFEVVIEALMYGTGMSEAECFERMMKCHSAGWYPLISYENKDIAQTVANKITIHAAANNNWDVYRQFVNHKGPWPLDAEVMDAHQ